MRTLHRRLVAVEAKFDRAAKAIEQERERTSAVGRKTSVEEAKRFYEEFKESSAKQPIPKEREQMNAHQLIALYQQMVRGPTPVRRTK
jgi:hypothetical protein